VRPIVYEIYIDPEYNTMSWVNALKEYAKQTGKFAVPKRGSPEYEAVKKIQASLSPSAAAPPAPSKAPEMSKALKEKKVKAVKAAEKTPDQIVAETKVVKAAAKEKAAAKAAVEAAEKSAAAAARAAVEAKTAVVAKAPKTPKAVSAVVEPPKEVAGMPPTKMPRAKKPASTGVKVVEPAMVQFA